MTERKGASRCNTAARAFLRVIQNHVQNGGLVRDVAVGGFCFTIETNSDEQNRQKELPANTANGNQKSLGHLKGAKTIAR